MKVEVDPHSSTPNPIPGLLDWFNAFQGNPSFENSTNILMLILTMVTSKNGCNIGWLVVSTPLKNMTSSVGMMTFPTEWKNHPNVPNHQPGV
jgi:hypothetical protein